MSTYLGNHYRSDIANAVRKLKKVIDGVPELHLKVMMRNARMW